MTQKKSDFEKWQKKPVVIEAMNVSSLKVIDELIWAGIVKQDSMKQYGYFIETLEGNHNVKVGDWIIRGIKGEYYPCKPDIFKATYKKPTNKMSFSPTELAELLAEFGFLVDQNYPISFDRNSSARWRFSAMLEKSKLFLENKRGVGK